MVVKALRFVVVVFESLLMLGFYFCSRIMHSGFDLCLDSSEEVVC
jgi:hypothetical protein